MSAFPRRILVAEAWTKRLAPLTPEGEMPPGALEAADLFIDMLRAAAGWLPGDPPFAVKPPLGPRRAGLNPDEAGLRFDTDSGAWVPKPMTGAMRWACRVSGHDHFTEEEAGRCMRGETAGSQPSSPQWVPIDDRAKDGRNWVVRWNSFPPAIAFWVNNDGLWCTSYGDRRGSHLFTHYLPIEIPEVI